MMLGKLWRAIRAQINKGVNALWAADPIAQMQYEYDAAVAQLRDGREGLEQHRALVERVGRQVSGAERQLVTLGAKVKAYLAAGDRESAARFALELQRAEQELAENESQLELHESAYANNVAKIKHAAKKLSEVRNRIAQYDAELKTSNAEAEIATLVNNFNLDITTDFGQIEQMLQDKISLNRAKGRVAADLSGLSAIDLERERAMESILAEQALEQFESQQKLSPDANSTKIVQNPDPSSAPKRIEGHS
ncbi:MAG TPA: PspA/IM30 family protein [Pirellulales bacterium]|jgi:phage shock protein A